MDINKNIDEKIERALQSMDKHIPATPGPYLMTRINAALKSERKLNTWDKLYAIITRPVIAFACMAFVLILNILIITSYRDNDTIRFQADSSNEGQSYPTAANSALYDVENNIEP